MGYLTPSTLPTDTLCRVLLIPNDLEFLANVTGALQTLIFPDSWTKQGTLTPDQAAAALVDMFDQFCFDTGICRMIGEIIPYAGATSPNTKMLLCDGASLLRGDYPDLFTVIGTAYGAADSTHFNIPDLRGRVPLGAGAGSGLSTYALGASGGEEAHTLVSGEMPSHSHTDLGHTHVEGNATPTLIAIGPGAPAPSAVPSVGVTGSGSANLTATGGGSSHENRQPYLAISYLIVALP
jgi:microcystin-dependent protein